MPRDYDRFEQLCVLRRGPTALAQDKGHWGLQTTKPLILSKRPEGERVEGRTACPIISKVSTRGVMRNLHQSPSVPAPQTSAQTVSAGFGL
jgi:hypothetical protein